MRAKGITYDTGFVNAGHTTRETFDLDIVRRELRVIRDDLHCAAVRVTGGDPARLHAAAGIAADLGLEVWFSPFTCDLTQDELLDVLADCADRAEALRRAGANIVLTTGAELSLFTAGFLPGDTCVDRVKGMLSRDPRTFEAMGRLPVAMNEFLGQAVRIVRARFGGPVSYASIWFEQVDWTPFDFLGIDQYRSKETAATFPDAMRALVGQGKPVAITEFGCACFRGAADAGPSGGDIVEWDGPTAVGLTGDYQRDEQEQADCLRELLDVFAEAGVDTAFLRTFACYHLPHRDGPRADLDLASGGIVKVLEHGSGAAYPGLAWEPKLAFATIAAYYGK